MKTHIFHFCLLFLLGSPSISSATASLPDTTTRLPVSFYSGNNLVKGWLFKPVQTSKQKQPVIVMAPGFSGTKECNYQFYAEHFSKTGFAVLLFDYPNFGESEGLTRQEADPWIQVQAYRDAITYCTTQEHIDPQRIGVWGGSYSGGHAIVVSALDKRVRCMVAMTPFISGSFYLQNMPEASRQFLLQQFNADRLNRIKGEKPAVIPVVSDKKGDFCAVAGKNAWNFVESFKSYAPTFKNAVTLKSLELQLEYEPGSYAARIDSIPKLFIVAKQDEMIPEQLIVDACKQASEPKKIIYLDGWHFSPYMEKLEEASAAAAAWFKEHL